MGNDGGSIPTRRELVKNAARDPNTTELKATQQEAQTHAWTYCPLSNRPLAAPIVSDYMGTLYNKDAIIEYLLPSSSATDHPAILQGRVHSLRDVVDVHFAYSPDNTFCCPLSTKQLGPSLRSIYLIPCGHAYSATALRQLRPATCPQCDSPFATNDIIPILPLAAEDLESLEARMGRLRNCHLTHSLKKAPGKKRKNAEQAKAEAQGEAAPAGIKNPATAQLTGRVLEEQEARNKRRKLELNDNLKTIFSGASYNAQSHKGGDFMTRGYSIPK
jgi:hypothetical protein